MLVNMTIQNADNALIAALKSVCKLYPDVRVSIKKQDSFADELRAEKKDILDSYKKRTLKTYNSMEEYEAAHGL